MPAMHRARFKTTRALARGATVCLAVALLASGCNSSGGASGGTASGGSSGSSQKIELYSGMSAAKQAPMVDTAKYKKNIPHPVIGYANLNLVNSFQVQRQRSAEMVAKQYGAKLIATNANNDPSKQISDVEDLLAQGVNALVISPITTESLRAVLARAKAAGVPVVTEGAPVDSPDVVTQVYVTNTSFGAVGGQGLCNALGGHGDVVMLRGIAGVEAEKDRYVAAKKAMTDCGLRVVGEAYGNWDFSGGKKAMETLAASHPKIDGVWSSGSEMTRAAIEVLQAEHRPIVPMTGECENGYLELWKSLNMKSVAPLFPTWQTPEAVKLALKILRGEPVMQRYDLDLPPITNATLNQFVNPSLPKDWWSDGYTKNGKVINYLTPAQVKAIFTG